MDRNKVSSSFSLLCKRYQLQNPLGHSHSERATVWRGHDMRLDRPVAIKVLDKNFYGNPKFVIRLLREAQVELSLQHPNLVRVYDYGHSGDGNCFLVMELIDGTDLRHYLHAHGVVATEYALLIAQKIALGLGAAHGRGIVHCAVIPPHILIGGENSIKLAYLGMAGVNKRAVGDRFLTLTCGGGQQSSIVSYGAPELLQGVLVGPAADVYALGAIMYEMVTGHPPFEADSPLGVALQHIQNPPPPPSQLNLNIPPVLEEIILRCLEKEPEMRYRDGNALARSLEQLGEKMTQ